MFSLQQVVDGVISNNLKWILMDAIVFFNDLSYESIAFKLLTFGVNGVTIFHNVKLPMWNIFKRSEYTIHNWCIVYELQHQYNSHFFVSWVLLGRLNGCVV